YVIFFFFFSSRRRHTRCLSDWSSDVCSSDLSHGLEPARACLRGEVAREPRELSATGTCVVDHWDSREEVIPSRVPAASRRMRNRSEERRVGKECGARWSGEE